MSYDPQQPVWGNPGGGPNPGEYGWPGGAPQDTDAFPPPGTAYQPPEGTYPGGYVPPPGQQEHGYPGGYPPPQGQAPYYGAYPGPMPASTSAWAIASLILSIASWLFVPFVGAVAGVICGHIALNEINQSEGRVEGRGMAIAGLIIGYINLAAMLCAVGAFVLLFMTALQHVH